MPRYRSPADEIEAYPGDSFLNKLVEAANPSDKGFISLLFLTGGRISEVLSLRRQNFSFSEHPDLIVVKKMIVKKKKKKTRRSFPIRTDDPTVGEARSFLVRTKGKLFDFSRSTGHRKVRKLGSKIDGEIPFSDTPCSELCAHHFRAMRACHLVEKYDFGEFHLNQFFVWGGETEASKYASMAWKDLARRMGVDV